MIIVTGGLGFIGSNLVFALNSMGREDIIIVDDFTDGKKFHNIVGAKFLDYFDKAVLLKKIATSSLDPVDAIFHQGACSTTTEWNGKFMMEVNYDYSKALLDYANEKEIPFIYASSAAVYGNNKIFIEGLRNEAPINVYGYSKYLFDQYVRRRLLTVKSQIVGLRYFNVYGPRESHKGSMASVAYHHYHQFKEIGKVKLFQGCDGYGDGEQRRDFIYVDDAVNVNLWFLKHPEKSGIFNVGTGRSETFNSIAQAVINFYGKGKIDYIPFPAHLQGYYQSFTQADISDLKNAGYSAPFKTVTEGVKSYLAWLEKYSS